MNNFTSCRLVTEELIDGISDLKSPLVAGSRETLSIQILQEGSQERHCRPAVCVHLLHKNY